ncbi:DUF4132 domain-containing protein [Actinocorallia sp. A-T 12471]|uniref:DUF4132 domain-containing protein n=1 Tax=Actinocorallia sp. A-T 12471 TaxID=3089813 RepID=UPI0029CF2B70|nr:DUF4132 domain-containing protein [Actinocorallia sp. A-T 12471]MDX6742780.1 DUF4132 domain-containing protein [Actinocorallia sp. A-T 12471]
MGWVSAGEGYEIALVEGKVAVRATTGRSAGRQLKTLPKALRDHPEVERLRGFAEWLDRHAAACVAQVDAWMVSSLPVPTALIGRVWADEAWRVALRDLAVLGDDPDEVGFLRDATPDGELRVVNLDGETVRLAPETVTLPHPVLLPDLDDLREFAAELELTQRVEQIYRTTFAKPGDLAPDAVEEKRFSGGSYGSRFRLAARATSLGYKVSGGFASCGARDGAQTLDATMWIGEPYWDGDAETGALTFRNADGRAVKLVEVGPVAWSEGMRMASALYAGRNVEEKA